MLISFSLVVIVVDSAIINSCAALGGRIGGKIGETGPHHFPEFDKPSIETFRDPTQSVWERPDGSLSLKFSVPEIEKKIEPFKENNLKTYPEQTTKNLYKSDSENFQSIVNYVRAFAHFILITPEIINNN